MTFFTGAKLLKYAVCAGFRTKKHFKGLKRKIKIQVIKYMSKLFGYYNDNVDHTWYDSSNVLYTECIDTDEERKILKVVFSNGSQYQYKDVPVMDYLVFREDASQGKALNRIIKSGKYPYEKLENANVELLKEELNYRMAGGLFYSNDENGFTLNGSNGTELYHKDTMIDEETLNMIATILKGVGVSIKNKKVEN